MTGDLYDKEKTPPRESILQMLENAGDWVSGEAVSQRLGISRAAVSKHVAALRGKGHAIEAVTRKGYRLLAKRDVLDGESLAASLGAHIFGKRGVTFLETTTSTNLYAARMVEENAREGHVVIAERQTRGRGSMGRDWFSAPRSIQFSVLLYPQASFWDAKAFTRLGALAVADAVRECAGLDAVFKKPNDVLVNGKKIAGVLVETGYRGNDPEWAVIGIGCNVNALQGDFPQAARNEITSVLEESGSPVSRSALLATILKKLETAYQGLRAGAADA